MTAAIALETHSSHSPGAPATGRSSRRWRSGLVGKLLPRIFGFLKPPLHRLVFRGGHGLDAPRQTRTVSRHPASEARPSVWKRIDMETHNTQLLHTGLERGSLGGVLDGSNGHSQLFRRGQSQSRWSGRLGFLRSLGADQRLGLGLLHHGPPWNVGLGRIRRLRGSRHHGWSKHRRTAEEGCRTPLWASRIGAAARRHNETAQQGRHT